ncbi:YidH family protein [Maricaulis sp. CAU 1757]
MAAEDRTELAEQRTNWAEDRTVLANERTFAGWMRTGFASVGIGLAIQAIFSRVEPLWMAKSVATAFFVVAIAVFIASYLKANAVLERLDSHTARPVKRTGMRLLCGMVTLATLALIVFFWSFSADAEAARL